MKLPSCPQLTESPLTTAATVEFNTLPSPLDADTVLAIVRKAHHAFFHSSFAHSFGTCAMPEEVGGWVDAELRVYGVLGGGLRVVDARVMSSLSEPRCRRACTPRRERSGYHQEQRRESLREGVKGGSGLQAHGMCV
ncbi:hypothetical protein C7999DRAFT_35971 [Corynascus novoguineensis]|uniref:Glucose-methanol-choline oxidoreductase C-terminal domain-containing protein n=1 Tax=Corynascus novoguineensis TaxID=1126955 RepID=A0AAN7HFS6_9PEZI|nr:hypothetical protein C7999DRAFT_35971 [Corynascus novoguineensis]